jgi:glycosyltransferase involved in cell wall biosynthesis
MVLNEERFVRSAILSVLPIAAQVLVYDTGSTDRTLDEVASIQSDKIVIVKKPMPGPGDLSRYHTEMIEQTKTEWFMMADGDEIYPDYAIQRIRQEMERIPANIHRILIERRHFIGSFNFLVPTHAVGRIYRTDRILWHGDYGVQTPYLKGDPKASFDPVSLRFTKDIFFFHCHNLSRSSKDGDIGRLRRRRTPRFPACPYFGPWPETLPVDNATRSMTSRILFDCVGLNLYILWVNWVQVLEKILKKIKQGIV